MVTRIITALTATPPVDRDLLAAIVDGSLTEAQARDFAAQSPEVIVFTLLALAQRTADAATATGAHAPSGAIPPFVKPLAKKKSKSARKVGAQPGHEGKTRPAPERVDRRETHQLPVCPECGGDLQRTGRTRTRVTEDIPANLQPEVVEHTLHRDWCPCCKKQVEPKLPDALPQCKLGNRSLAGTPLTQARMLELAPPDVLAQLNQMRHRDCELDAVAIHRWRTGNPR